MKERNKADRLYGVEVYECKEVFTDHTGEEFKKVCREFDKDLGKFRKYIEEVEVK